MDRDGLTIVPEASVPVETTPGGHRADARRGGTFRALHSVPFRLYFFGQVASASGTFLQQTAIGWLVLELTGNAASLGLVLAVGGVPSLLFGPWGGAIADRVGPAPPAATTRLRTCHRLSTWRHDKDIEFPQIRLAFDPYLRSRDRIPLGARPR